VGQPVEDFFKIQPAQLVHTPMHESQRQSLAIHLNQLVGNHTVQRLSIASGASPNADWQTVPANHRARVRGGLSIIDDLVASSDRLKNYFKNNAPGGTDATLANVASRAKIWEMKNEGNLGESYEGGSDMAYDPYIYRIGRWQIASTLLHEMGHLARFPTEELCEQTLEAARAYSPFIESIAPQQARVGDEVTIRGMSFGPSQTAVDRVEFSGVDAGTVVSWRWSHAGGEIRVRVPAGATSGPVTVISNNIRSNEVRFRVMP
jgi:hypothetical protein